MNDSVHVPVLRYVLLPRMPVHCAFVGTLNPSGQGSVVVFVASCQLPLAEEVVFHPVIADSFASDTPGPDGPYAEAYLFPH